MGHPRAPRQAGKPSSAVRQTSPGQCLTSHTHHYVTTGELRQSCGRLVPQSRASYASCGSYASYVSHPRSELLDYMYYPSA